MTELETMQRAKMYLEKLSRGIDPITDREMPEDSVLNNVRICRCLHYVSGVLDQVIANGGVVGKREGTPFVIDRSRMGSIRLTQSPVSLTEFTGNIVACMGDPQYEEAQPQGHYRLADPAGAYGADHGPGGQTAPPAHGCRIPGGTEHCPAHGRKRRISGGLL